MTTFKVGDRFRGTSGSTYTVVEPQDGIDPRTRQRLTAKEALDRWPDVGFARLDERSPTYDRYALPGEIVCITFDGAVLLPGEGAKQEPSRQSGTAPDYRIVQCPKCNHKSPGGTIHEKNCGVPVDPAPQPSRHLRTLMRDFNAETVAALVVKGRDYSDDYEWCRACKSYVARGVGRYRREIPHGVGCEAGPALGKATRSRP